MSGEQGGSNPAVPVFRFSVCRKEAMQSIMRIFPTEECGFFPRERFGSERVICFR
ncbi:MAG: hypothetical protein K5985_04825 [Lachnospiraceae bacterium]|nr:hypothetical protein [Lachnospiraceae bacterium]